MIHLSNRKIPNTYYTLFPELFERYYILHRSFPTSIHKIYYCGRPSILGNPFSHLNNSMAKQKCKQEFVLLNFENYLYALNKDSKQILLLKQIRDESINNDVCLECWCVPKKCHCEIIFKYIKEKL